MRADVETRLSGAGLAAWRSFVRSHAAIVRALDSELDSEHGVRARDYEVLLSLAQADDRRLAMSALAERTMLTRSGVTRLVDGLVADGLVRRVACLTDARVAYAQLTDAGEATLVEAGATHLQGVGRLFADRFTLAELERLAELLGRLPGATGGGDGCAV